MLELVETQYCCYRKPWRAPRLLQSKVGRIDKLLCPASVSQDELMAIVIPFPRESLKLCGSTMDGNMKSHMDGRTQYSVLRGAKQALDTLKLCVANQLSPEVKRHLGNVTFNTSSDDHGTYFPCPFKETEAAAALKAVEGSIVAAISDLRYGSRERKINVDLEKTTAFLFSTYLAKVGGLSKGDPEVKSKLKGKCNLHLPNDGKYD